MNSKDRLALLAAGALASRPQTVTERRTVVERRAPTDESVRLLKEMEKAAEDRVIASMALRTNTLSGQIHVMQNHMDQSFLFRLVFDLNGNKVVVNHTSDAVEPDWKETALRALLEKASNEVIAALMREVDLGQASAALRL